MARFHELEGFVIVAGWLLLFLFGIGLFITKRDAGRLYWGLLTGLQVLLGIQPLVGLVLLFAAAASRCCTTSTAPSSRPWSSWSATCSPVAWRSPLPSVLHHRVVLRVRPHGTGPDDRARDRLTGGARPATLSFNLRPARR